MQDQRIIAIKQWMASSPAGPIDKMTSLFERFSASGNLPYTEVTAEEALALLGKCFEWDEKGGTHLGHMGVVGAATSEQFPGFPTEPPYSWWPKELHGSVIQVGVYSHYHELGKIGDDRFMIHAHVGWLADRIRDDIIAELAKREREYLEREREYEANRRAQEATKRQEEERLRQEAEAKRQAEEQWQSRIRAQRRSAAQCVMCGRALTFFLKFMGRDRHGACRVFIAPQSAADTTQPNTPSTLTVERPGVVLFLFNSNAQPAEAQGGYGAFSETALLKHLFARWKVDTGQDIAKTEVKACHGDLFDRHPLGDNACSLRKLGTMMRHDNLDGNRLRVEFDSAVRAGTRVNFIPWAVGLSPVPDSVVRSVHEALETELPKFYLGVICIPPSWRFEAIVSNLALPQTMRIRKGKLVGDWQGKAP